MNRLYYMEIDALINDSVVNEMLLYVSREKRERVLRYRNEIDKKIGIYAEVLARCLICSKLGVNYKDIEIGVDPAGKPYLTSLPCCAFNISHTRNAIAVCVSDEPVGVDIERIKTVDMSIAERVFSENERAWLHDTTGDQKLRFFSIWTKKEAFIKHDGRGLSYDMKSFDVTGSFPHVYITTFMADNYVISLCSSVKSQGTDFVKITEPELIAMWRGCTN